MTKYVMQDDAGWIISEQDAGRRGDIARSALLQIPQQDWESTPNAAATITTLRGKATQALTSNATYLAQPPIPAGTLTTAQLGAALRIVRSQVDLITRENNAIIRLLLGALADVSDT